MSASQSAGGVVRALRSAVQQAHAGAGVASLLVRPPGSLITSTPSTSFGVSCQISPVRAMSQGVGVDPWSWFDYRKVVYPDVYDPNEALLASRYKSHGMLVKRYEPPSAITRTNPLADPELEKRSSHFWDKLWTYALCYRSVWGFSKSSLQAHALEAYKNVNAALASGDMKLAEPYVSEQMLQRLAGEVARRGRRVEVRWELVDPQPDAAKDVELVLGADTPNPMKQGKLHFVQWTARIASRQRVAVYDSKGKLVAGDPDKVLDVVDYWVFERAILKNKFMPVPRPGPMDAQWRLVERL